MNGLHELNTDIPDPTHHGVVLLNDATQGEYCKEKYSTRLLTDYYDV